MTLKHKPTDQQVRIVFTDAPERAMPEHRGRVFALIGPFENHQDKADVQKMILALLRGWNIEAE